LPARSLAEGDVAAGQKVFKKCKACHAVGEGAKHGSALISTRSLAARRASAEGYKYSKAMIEAGEGGLVWDAATLAQYLASPKGMIKGTKMAFAGLKKDDDIANVTPI
jgi:cytochrome c2